MQIMIDVPDSTKCMNISLVYQKDDWSMAMAASMVGVDILKDGARIEVPKRNDQADE